MIAIFADWTAPVGATASAVAAGAALVAIVYAKQAAVAARKTVSEEHQLRIEEDFREFGRELWALFQAAGDARRAPDDETVDNRMRHAQTRLRSVLVTPVWIDFTDDQEDHLEWALDSHRSAVDVYSACAALVDDLDDAWQRRPGAREAPRRTWPPVDGLFGSNPSGPPGDATPDGDHPVGTSRLA